MYAVVEVGGRQYRVSPGDEIYVEKLDAEAGSEVRLPTLLVSDESGVTVGKPHVEGREITAHVLGNEKGDKLIVFKYLPKKRHRRKVGHRQTYTRLKIVGFAQTEVSNGT
ncbi:MAG: 50S ribosomal protein L21 [Anaerolineae bacterium]|nr:50S ribosomal protein L21 [Thermoflexales bacterium]MDW8396734.1 50S ribosomal protein L21 [Anaerolineae bacterium]